MSDEREVNDAAKDEREFSEAADDLDEWLKDAEEGKLIDPSTIPYSGSSRGPTGRGVGVNIPYSCARPHRGHAVKGVPTLLGSSYRDGLVIPGNSVTVLLTREAMMSAFPAGWASYSSPEFNSHLRGALVFWPWTDMSVPTDLDSAERRIKELHVIHKSGKVIEVACFGGHGRTGTLLAILAALYLGWRGKDAVGLLRRAYCDRAVESKAQEAFVESMVERAQRWV